MREMDFHPEESADASFDGFDYQDSTVDQSFEGAFPTAADEGFVSPPPQLERNVRRYSGMEIPFGVIEETSNVHEMNPMRNSKRLSALGLFPSVIVEDIPSPQILPVNDTNPLRINRRASLNPLRSRNKPVDADDVPFGVNEPNDRVGHELNPMRTSAKFKAANSPLASPKKPFSEPAVPLATVSTSPFNSNAASSSSSSSTTSSTEETKSTPARMNITTRDIPLIRLVSEAAYIGLLFGYIVGEIVYELGLEAIKPNQNQKE